MEMIFKDKSMEDLIARVKSRPVKENPLPPRIPKEMVITKEAQKERLEKISQC